MTGLLTRLGARIETRGGKAKMARFLNGWPATATPQVKFHRTAKVQYRYVERGSGPTIVFTCDPPMTIEVYAPLVEAFSKHFRVVVVELPAMGFSATTANYAFGFRETNDDLAAFLRNVAGEGSIFAFSCAASLAALDIARRMPELASNLTLIQAGGTEAFAIWKAGRDPKGILARPIVGQLAMARMAHKRMPQWYGLSVGRKEHIPHFCSCAERSFQHGAMWSLASAYQIYMNWQDELPRPAQPILSIWGAADGSHPPSNAHSLARLYEGVKTVTFNDLGHTPELEAPDLVLAAILDFCSGTVMPASDSVPSGYEPHSRKSPVTDPWEPLFVQQNDSTFSLGLRVAAAHCNSRGLLHGGVISALADNAMGLACVTQLERCSALTISLSVDFHSVVHLGQWLEVRAVPLKLGRTLAFADARIEADGEMVAKAAATFRIIETVASSA